MSGLHRTIGAKGWENVMVMSIGAGGRSDNGVVRDGVVVPPAAVWAGGRAEVFCVNPVHIRTLVGSNSVISQPPAGHRNRSFSHSNTGFQGEDARPVQHSAVGHGNDSPRSIAENLKQWAGGALFGLAIFGGILFAQHGQEEPLPTFSESQLAGLDVATSEMN